MRFITLSNLISIINVSEMNKFTASCNTLIHGTKLAILVLLNTERCNKVNMFTY